MCGIAGLLGAGSAARAHLVTDMASVLRHRGPDGVGLWSDPEGGIVLAHRRLAIIDLSESGAQPMLSADGRWALTYNGEIYNHADLRRALEAQGCAPTWRGHSDTEILLAAIAAWGVAGALERAAGMFALAAWDRRERCLYLARDRFGEKPLYYGQVGAALAFASELKAIAVLPELDRRIDPSALRAFLGRGYIPADRSIYAGIAQIPPGCIARFTDAADEGQLDRYYDYAAVVAAGAADPIGSHGAAVDAVDAVLGDAVERQLAADVPVGTLLSGGIDSSLITALAARRAGGPVSTFSIGFAEDGYDEAPHARAVAAHLGTNHHELYCTAQDALEVIPKLASIWDEPFGDSSQIPTFLVSRFARSKVTVSLSGDAGDELFGGYQRHRALPALARRLGRVPKAVRGPALRLGEAVPPGMWNTLARLRHGARRPDFFGHKVRRALRTASRDQELGALYHAFLDDWFGEPSPLHYAVALPRADFPSATLDPAARVMLADALGYLPGDILTKIDRAAMAVSLEGRVPFLDPAVAALAARIGPDARFHGNRGKAVLRTLLARYVPAALIDRPKAGFAMPMGRWLAGPLRDWCEDLLAQDALADSGLLDPLPIRRRWQRHLAGQEDASQALWSVLMFQAWRREWDPAARAASAPAAQAATAA